MCCQCDRDDSVGYILVFYTKLKVCVCVCLDLTEKSEIFKARNGFHNLNKYGGFYVLVEWFLEINDTSVETNLWIYMTLSKIPFTNTKNERKF